MKKIVIFLLLIFFAVNVFAIKLQSHTIDIEIDEEGMAKIIEYYELRFENINEIDFFQERVQINSSGLLAWETDYEFFYPHFELPNNRVYRSSVTFEQATNLLILEYELEKPLATLISDEPRETNFGFSDKQLTNFLKEGLIIIPENTLITLRLPKKAQILGQSPQPQIEINENTVLIKPITASKINLEYIIQKPIQTKVNSLELFGDFFSNSSNIVIIIIALVLTSIILWKRKGITKKIEDYVVEHSEIEAEEIKEDVELEV